MADDDDEDEDEMIKMKLIFKNFNVFHQYFIMILKTKYFVKS